MTLRSVLEDKGREGNRGAAQWAPKVFVFLWCSQALQRDMQTRAASFASVLKATEEFLEENRTKMNPEELAALQDRLHHAKKQYQSLQERTEVAQKELENAVTAAVQQETEKVTHPGLSWGRRFYRKTAAWAGTQECPVL